MKNKRIAFFGTPDFTVEFLDLFKKLGLDLSLIVTGEDKPVGRGMLMKSPGPKKWAEKSPALTTFVSTSLSKEVNTDKEIIILQPKKLDEEFWQLLKTEHEKENFDLFIVIAYGKIIPERIINLPRYGTINLHYSLLPKYRGASPVESSILNGDIETGITIQQMVYKLDAGNVLYQEKIEIREEETANELRERMNKRALEILPDFLSDFFLPSLEVGWSISPTGGVSCEVQDESQATVCGKFSKDDFDVTKDIQTKNIEVLFKKYRAFNKKIYFFFGEKNLRVKITEMSKNEILKVLPESRKEITLRDFENSFGKIF